MYSINTSDPINSIVHCQTWGHDNCINWQSIHVLWVSVYLSVEWNQLTAYYILIQQPIVNNTLLGLFEITQKSYCCFAIFSSSSDLTLCALWNLRCALCNMTRPRWDVYPNFLCWFWGKICRNLRNGLKHLMKSEFYKTITILVLKKEKKINK